MKTIFGGSFAALLLSVAANANPVSLITNSYNFQLQGGGGGSSATLGGVPVEIFCDDFNNDIYVPQSNYTANVTTLNATTTSADLNETRFGGVTSWTAISGPDASFFTSTTGQSSVVRYDLAAYLVSQYDRKDPNTGAVFTSNEALQAAIWTLMDPSSYGTANIPAGPSPTTDLDAAVTWYQNNSSNTAYLNSFLSQFQIVSDSTMTFSRGLGVGGFQEQIIFTPTPEPRAVIWTLVGLFGVLLIGARRKASVEVAGVGHETQS